MIRWGTLLLLTLGLAATALAGTIADIRAGLVPQGTVVDVQGAVVTALLDQSLTVAEVPGGPDLALWVLLDGAPTVAAGDVVDLRGTYLEHNERATLSLWSPADAFLTVTGQDDVPVSVVDAAALAAAPETWESVLVLVDEMLTVTGLTGEGGLLAAGRDSQGVLVLDDYYGVLPAATPGDCYDAVRGIFFRYQGEHVLKVQTLTPAVCSVGAEARRFSELKSMFR